jgi:hypothetical protein
MNPTVRLGASILALTVLGGCSFHMGAAPPSSPPPAPAEAATEVNPAPSSNERTPSSRASWVPAHWEVQGRSKTWVDGHWG